MKTMPSRIVTAGHLRDAQLSMAHCAQAPTASHERPLTASGGRVLARALDILDTNGHGCTLPPGTRLDWYLLPLLAASSHASVPVFAPVRCGIVAQQPDAADGDAHDPLVGTVMLQAALEKMGVRVVGASTASPLQCDLASLEPVARHCDLLLVMARPGVRRPVQPGLAAPATFEVGGRPCVVLPDRPLAALGTLLAFVVPLIRRLQGRALDLPPLRTATEAGTDLRLRNGSALVCVSATGHGDAIQVRPCAPRDGSAVQRLADISGVAWRAEGLQDDRGRLLCYLPLTEWLH